MSVFDAIAGDAVYNHGALQKPDELAGFLAWAANHFDGADELVVVEVGADAGGTLYAWRTVWPNADVCAISLPHGFGSTHRPLNPHGAHLIAGDSHDAGTVRELDAWLAGRPVDLLFLDGDHRAAGITCDIELYAPRVRVGGVLALHDIVNGDGAAHIEVPAVWAHYAGEYRTAGHTVVEFIAANPSWGGIGAVVR